MSRGMTSALATALSSSMVKPFFLAKFEFPTGNVLFWTGSGDLEWPAASGDTYTGLASLSALEFPAETTGGSSGGAQFGLSGIPSSITGLALTETYKNSICTVWLGAMDNSNAVIADPYLKYKGFIDVIEMSDDGNSASVGVRVEGFAYGVGPSDRKYTDVDQQREYPGDRGLEYVAGLQERKIIWGATTEVDHSERNYDGSDDDDEYYDDVGEFDL